MQVTNTTAGRRSIKAIEADAPQVHQNRGRDGTEGIYLAPSLLIGRLSVVSYPSGLCSNKSGRAAPGKRIGMTARESDTEFS